MVRQKTAPSKNPPRTQKNCFVKQKIVSHITVKQCYTLNVFHGIFMFCSHFILVLWIVSSHPITCDGLSAPHEKFLKKTAWSRDQWWNAKREKTVSNSLQTICEQPQKSDERRNCYEARIECREWFIMIREHFTKNFFVRCVHWSRRSFDELKERFSPYFQLLHTFAETTVHDE